jgi:peptidase M22 family protein
VSGCEKRYFLGIDTSNYTTSAAAVDEDGRIIAFSKRLLPVRAGGAGLRQSEAVFSHVRQLPGVMDELASQIRAQYKPDDKVYGGAEYGAEDITGSEAKDRVDSESEGRFGSEASEAKDSPGIKADRGELRPAAVGYSARPRDAEGSYMPCFLVGESTALSLSSVCGVPAYDFSHQAGHLAAAVYGCGEEKLKSEPFYAFHVSGGTTEILDVGCDGKITLLGGTKDISAGQLIDRVGVMLGMHFPCGPELERAAAEYSEAGGELSSVPAVCVRGPYCNLSGLENKLSGLKNSGRPMGEIALYAITAVWLTLEKLTLEIFRAYGTRPVLYAGGVMSCAYIKERLGSRFDAYFAPPELSSDNAAGAAILCRKKYLSENGVI